MATVQSPPFPNFAPVMEKDSPASQGIDEARLERLYERIEAHISAGWYPGAAIAMARRGLLVAARSFGVARLATTDKPAVPADLDSMWLLYSQTKPITSCAIWSLVEHGKLRFHDAVADYIPEFARFGKAKITLYHLLSHQAGFPDANVPPEAWEDHKLLRESVCNFTLEWEPGARVMYHSAAAHWTQAVLIEAVTGQDYRQFIRDRVLQPLGLHSLCVGVPDALHERLVGAYQRTESGVHEALADRNTPAFWRGGVPGGGGYSTATDLVAFYQMLLHLGALNGTRILGPRTVQYVTRNHTGDRLDERFGIPMHRGLGVHVRGVTPTIRGLGSTATPNTFGHGGAGTSYSWADPGTGVSFTYLTNSQMPEPYHSRRLDEIMTLAHAAVVEL
ncbi:MAG TPA: serine hydrolase domain-containing protein [Candidatus Tectomicrobia bacterium]|nr:serine hydrolase domain-containing protein [Candidatus Tectomicrobia bacterium]